jgi:hypothetical protein
MLCAGGCHQHKLLKELQDSRAFQALTLHVTDRTKPRERSVRLYEGMFHLIINTMLIFCVEGMQGGAHVLLRVSHYTTGGTAHSMLPGVGF